MFNLVSSAILLITQILFAVQLVEWSVGVGQLKASVYRSRRCVELMAFRLNIESAKKKGVGGAAGIHEDFFKDISQELAEYFEGCQSLPSWFEAYHQKSSNQCPNWWARWSKGEA